MHAANCDDIDYYTNDDDDDDDVGDDYGNRLSSDLYTEHAIESLVDNRHRTELNQRGTQVYE